MFLHQSTYDLPLVLPNEWKSGILDQRIQQTIRPLPLAEGSLLVLLSEVEGLPKCLL